MALVPLADKGNVLHIYDFRVKEGMGDAFIKQFEEFDYSDANPMHKSSAQVRDGVLCRDANDPHHFFLIGEWKSIEEHKKILKILAEEVRPKFVMLVDGGPTKFLPTYAEVVSSTPLEYLQPEK
jgi:quinol monooxygenase YgiN